MKVNSNNKHPKVSIIIPTYNSELTLRRAICSIINQTYDCWEIWVIDGYSSDGTIDVVEGYLSKTKRIQYISELDNGIYDAMNKGIELAQGEWLYFMGSDDVLYNTKVLSNVFESRDINSAKLLYGNKVTDGRWYGGRFNKEKIVTRNINHQCIFYRKTLFREIGSYETNSITRADHLFNMRVFAKHEMKCHYIDQVVADYGAGGASTELYDTYFDEHLERKLLDIFEQHLPKKDIYPGLANSAFAHLYCRNFYFGLKRWFKVIVHSRRPVYFLWNGLYWIKERLKFQLSK